MSTISASTTTTTAYKVAADTTGTLVFQTGATPTTAVTIDASQNVGVGVTPSAWTLKAVQNGNAAFWTSATNAYLSSNLYYGSGGRTYISNGYSSELGLSTGGFQFQISASGTAGGAITQTQAMTLDASGNLYVGAAATSSASRLGVRGSGTGSAWEIYSENSTPSQNFGVRDDGNIYAGRLGASTGTALVLNANGYIYTLTSSLRYKKDVEPIDIGLDFILGLNPVKYNLKESDEPQVGFIAEDFPDARLVSMSRIDKEDESKGLQAESVNYAQIVAPLVKAIQEQQALITQLQADVAALKGAA